MKKLRLILSIITAIVFFQSCFQKKKDITHKDLDECMIDLKMYQENMGLEIKEGRLQDARWLWEGTDSLLDVIEVSFEEHRKLKKPFAYYRAEKLAEPMEKIGLAIKANDTTAAVSQYRLLVQRCNNCHIQHKVNKKVFY